VVKLSNQQQDEESLSQKKSNNKMIMIIMQLEPPKPWRLPPKHPIYVSLLFIY